MNIPETILRYAEEFPDKTAYIYENESITYGELSRRSRALAAHLGSGAPVMVYGHRSPLMIIGMLACLICGRAYIPCDISIPRERIRSMLMQSGADTVITAEYSLDIKGIKMLSASEIYSLPENKCACCGSNCDIAYIIFTSGSTGQPKGIKIPRISLENFVAYALSVYPRNADIFGGHALFSFDLSVADIFLPLTSGRTFHAFDKFPAEDIEILTCTPTYLRMCLLSKAFSPEKFPALKAVLCCGEVLPVRTAAALRERFPDVRLINAYGPAECCCFVCAHEVTENDLTRECLPIGDTPFTAGEISVKDGEIFIGGDSAKGGYIGEYADNGFAEGGYYTGDRGVIREGLIFFEGRINSGTVKYSGYRIELREIEAVLSEIGGITDCCVQAVTDGSGTVKLIKALVISEKDIDVSAVKKKLSEKLPDYMIPKVIERSDSLPQSENGKIQAIERGTL